MEEGTRYDRIGSGYDATRKADPYLAGRMFHHLGLYRGGACLEIGCGTGNYTTALHSMGLSITGVDPSDRMLAAAREKSGRIRWLIGGAEAIPLEDLSVDGVLAGLTIHHWADLEAGFREVYRVLRPGGRFVILTSLPEQTARYWLQHYFPRMTRESAEFMPALEKIESAMNDAGLVIRTKEPYDVRPDIEDLFFYSGKHHPERYLDPAVRMGISSFSFVAMQDEVTAGLARLKSDIDSGAVREVMASAVHDDGDYIFIIAEKPH